MAGIFLSHSSANNAEAVAIHDWLASAGWRDVFLDLHPDRGIEAGQRWERALHEAASRCEAVIFLISKAWLASPWCLKELNLARRLNKPLFGVLIESVEIDDVPLELRGSRQLADLASGEDHILFRVVLPRTHEESHVTFSDEGLRRLRNGLTKAGLDPRFFLWPPEKDPDRPPYRGLRPIEADDAGIFFGREAAIIEALDTIRGLRERAAPRLLAILGASGAGKSSFLRAGLLPHLARDEHFLPLPVVRPERAALSGDAGLIQAVDALLAAKKKPQPRAKIRNALLEGAAALRELLQPLVDAAARAVSDEQGRASPMLVLAIDQAEELFATDGAAEGGRLLALVSDLVKSDELPLLVLFTIRSDSYDALETAKAFEGLRQHAFPLLPMPRGAFQTIIEGPAARLADTDRRLSIDPKLTHRLLEDVDKGGGSDALPLLAFTLEQLYLDYGAGGALALSHYQEFGGMRGAIEAAIARVFAAADRDPSIPRAREARLDLLRRGMIPWLAGIDPDTGTPRRRVALLSDIPEDARPLIQLLVEQRLLTTDRPAGKGPDAVTVEPSHEALLRQWDLLHGWLDQDFAALATLEAVKRAARDWSANGGQPDWLNHAGTRLIDAETIAARADLARNLPAEARAYLAACRDRENAQAQERRLRLEREQEEQARRLRDAETLAAMSQKSARNSRIFAGVGGTLALLALAGGVYAWLERGIAQQQASNAEQNFKIAVDGSSQLGNLVHDLASFGTISSRVADSFLAIPSKMVTVLSNEKESDDVIAVEWQLSNTLAIAYLSLVGRGETALTTAQHQKSLAQLLLQHKPGDPAYLRDLAVADENLGDAYDQQGKLDESLQANREAEATMRQILAKTPNDPDRQRDLGYIEQRISDALFKKGDMAGAGAAAQQMLDLFGALTKRPSPKPDWIDGFGLGHERFGDVVRDTRDLDGALTHYLAFEKIEADLVAQSEAQDARSPNRDWQMYLARAHERLGDIYLRQNKIDLAANEYQAYAQETSDGAAHDGGGNWQLAAADSDVRLGDLYQAQHQLLQAQSAYRAAVAAYEVMVKLDSFDLIPLKDLAIAYDRLGLALAASDPSQAGNQFKACLALGVDENAIDRQLPDPRRVRQDCQANIERIASSNR